MALRRSRKPSDVVSWFTAAPPHCGFASHALRTNLHSLGIASSSFRLALAWREMGPSARCEADSAAGNDRCCCICASALDPSSKAAPISSQPKPQSCTTVIAWRGETEWIHGSGCCFSAFSMSTGVFRVGLQDFTATAVVDQEFKEISLSQHRGKYVVLFFYP